MGVACVSGITLHTESNRVAPVPAHFFNYHPQMSDICVRLS